MRAALSLLLAASLLLVPAARGKGLVRTLVIASDGGSVSFPITLFWSAHGLGAPERLRGGYLLVYTVMERGLPARPGRFYPESAAYCGRWNLSLPPAAARCTLVPLEAVRRTTRLRLEAFSGEPPTLSGVRVARRSGGRGLVLRRPDNYLTGIELAFARRRDARAAARPAGCLEARASWAGAVGERPDHLCLSTLGAWANGRLYPYGPAVFDPLRSR